MVVVTSGTCHSHLPGLVLTKLVWIGVGCRVATTDAIVTEVGQCRHWFEELLHHHPRNTKQLPSAQARNANLELRQGRF